MKKIWKIMILCMILCFFCAGCSNDELNYNLRFWFAKLNSWESIWDKYKCYQLRF